VHRSSLRKVPEDGISLGDLTTIVRISQESFEPNFEWDLQKANAESAKVEQSKSRRKAAT